MEAYFLEVSLGRIRENECESKFLGPKTYIKRLSYEEKREAWEVLQGGSIGPAGEAKAEVCGISHLGMAWGTDSLGSAGRLLHSGEEGTLFTSSRGGF